MSDFLKKFLIQDPRRTGAGGAYVALAAFGKHPGWDDHVEDLGLETEGLNLAKTVLYVDGIGGQIDSGAWEKLDAAQQLPAFNHLFVWQRSGQILVGRLWSSSDGKGRTRYPMVVCLHFAGVTLASALKEALPALAQLHEGCVAATSADDVRSLLARKRAALRESIRPSAARAEYAPVNPDVLHRILRSGDSAAREGFVRVMYQIQSQLGAFAPRKFNAASAPRPQQIRVPVAAENPEQALLFWTRFLLTQLDESAPLLLTLPLDAGWMDVTVGEPGSHELFCLRASPKAVPLVSEVPYTLEGDFQTKADEFLDRFERGETVPPNLPRPATAVIPIPRPAKSWRKWVGVSVFLLLAAAAAVFFYLKRVNQRVQPNPAGTNAQARSQLAGNDLATPTPPAPAPAIANPLQPDTSLADQTKKTEAAAAAAKLKVEAEAAARNKTRQMAEASQPPKAVEPGGQNDSQAQTRKVPAASGEARPKLAPVMASSLFPEHPSAGGEITNTIGMILVAMPWGFWVGKYEVTQAEFQKVIGTNPSKSVKENQPVESVSWNDALEFCRKLTASERSILRQDQAYSLPTQQQWTNFAGGLRFQDLPRGGFSGRSAPSVVGQSGPANKLGLYDVLGNVWEWCLDGGSAEAKLLKGGAFNKKDTYDFLLPPGQGAPNCGFRCVLASQ